MCMCGRREVTRKTLAETRTARKKNPTPNLQVIFLLKAFLRKALHCAGEGVTTKVPLGQLPTLPVHWASFVRSMCSTTTSTGFVGEGGSFFLSAMHVCIIHRIMQ